VKTWTRRDRYHTKRDLETPRLGFDSSLLNEISIGEAYDRAHAETVIQAAVEDYNSEYGND